MKKVIQTYPKTELKNALKFARIYSKTFSNVRVTVENYSDAGGIVVSKDNPLNHDNRELILFVNGIRKRAIA